MQSLCPARPSSAGRKNASKVPSTAVAAVDCSGGQLAADEVQQRSHRGERAAVDVVVVDDDVEAFLERRDQRNDGHRIELGDGTQQVRLAGEARAAPAEAE